VLTVYKMFDTHSRRIVNIVAVGLAVLIFDGSDKHCVIALTVAVIEVTLCRNNYKRPCLGHEKVESSALDDLNVCIIRYAVHNMKTLTFIEFALIVLTARLTKIACELFLPAFINILL